MTLSNKIIKKQTANEDGITLQTLALFIILLSFFIVLNSISSFEEEKIKPVMASIEATFAHRVIQQELAPSVTKNPDQATGEGTVYDQIDTLFQSQFKTLENVQKDDKIGLFYAEIPYKTLQTSLHDIRIHHIKESQETGSFINLLKTLLFNPHNSLRLDLVLQTSENIFSLSPEQQRDRVQKVASLGQQITHAQFPEDRISVGLGAQKDRNIKRNQDDMVLVIIRPHTPYSPYKSNKGRP